MTEKVNKMPLISVIIPAYDIESYLERCLESVRNQTYRNIQVIIVDDGSRDRTGEIADRFAKQDSRFSVIHKENAGVSAARKTGLEVAQGEYIGFVDGDDYIEPDMYQQLMSLAVEYEADISHCGYQMVFPDRVDLYHGTGELRIQDSHTAVKDLLEGTIVEPGLVNKLYRHDLFKGIEYDPEIVINEDLLLNFFLFHRVYRSVFLDEPFYHYMVRKNSASTSKWNEHKVMDPVRVLEKMRREEKNQELRALIDNRYIYQLVRVIIFRSNDNKPLLRKLRQIARDKLAAEYELLDRSRISRKNYWMGKIALIFPGGLSAVHMIYGCVTGSNRKYKV